MLDVWRIPAKWAPERAGARTLREIADALNARRVQMAWARTVVCNDCDERARSGPATG